MEFSCWSSTKPKCFWEEQVKRYLLNVTKSELTLLAFFEKYTFYTCLLGYGLSRIFHWEAQLFIACKSLFSSLCDVYLSERCGKRDIPSAKILQVDWMLSGKSLMHIIREPRTGHCGTSYFINSQEEVCSLRMTFW